VLRAPAYYQSSEMGVAHFNTTANLAAYPKPGSVDDITEHPAYPNMTAIDFAGHGNQNEVTGTYKLGSNDTWFYEPLLDDDGLLRIQNCDETQNLLAYAPAESAEAGYANAKTHGVLNDYFTEPIYDEHYDNTKGYRLVSEAKAASVHGHLVQSDLKATNDHLLVDKQDFNAPVAYDFDKDHLMWYQRVPADKEYVDLKKGWQGISLPFTAELVTTDTKGEITHFYSGSDESYNGTGKKKEKKGHEYWLREFKEGGTTEGNVYKAVFNYPEATAGSNAKTVTNTFLWDYYYQNVNVHNQMDMNSDNYQEYYRTARSYNGYAKLTAATPYILGLPGLTYYEFDLSGKFQAENTKEIVPQLLKQIITFASNNGEHIGVSDDEMTGKVVTYNNVKYIFKPNYLNESLTAGTNHYTLVAEYDSDGDTKADCSTFAKVPATGDQVAAFRPFFMSEEASSGTRTVERIDFIQTESNVGVEEEHGDPTAEELNGGLRIWSKKDKIYVESTLSFTEDVRVVTPAGITVASFAVKPGKTVEVKADFSGIYVVHTLDGKYIRKLSVKK
jgi:hypothetical protein